MYHGIVSVASSVPDRRESGAMLYDVSAAHFREQMLRLAKMDTKPAITFDDGEMNNYEVAFPILKELGLTAHFFVIVKRVGKPGYMGWPELKALVDGGMIIGSHGLTHEILTNLIDSQIEEELRASKRTLEANLEIPIQEFSIPRGFCNDKIINMAYKAGYSTVYISDRAHHIKAKCVPRVAVKGNWNLKRFETALAGRTPAKEVVLDFFKKIAKTILRESGYNFVRKMLIYVIK